jgi:hypothetical protein
VEPRHDALDIAVDDVGGVAVGDRGDGRGGVGADAGDLAPALFGLGETGGECLGGGVKVAGAGIVAEPGPGAENVVARGGGVGQASRKRAK